MADAATPAPDLAARLRQGSWEAAAPSVWTDPRAYFRAAGERMAAKSPRDQWADMEIVGPFVKTGEDLHAHNWGAAGLHGLEALLGLGTGGRSAGIAKGGRAAAAYLPDLQAALARSEALGAGVALTGKSGKPLKEGGAAYRREFDKAYPGPKAPPPPELANEATRSGRSLAEVLTNYESLNHSGPVAKTLAGTTLANAPLLPAEIAAGDARLGNPFMGAWETGKQGLADYDQSVRDHREPDKSYRLDDPHIKKIHDDMARTNNVLSGHIGAGAAMAAATPKLAQLGWRGTSGPMFGLAAELGMVHPLVGAAALGVAALPMLPAAAAAYGAYKMADDTGPLRQRALDLKDILDDYGRRGHDRFGPEAQASYPRDGS